MTLHLNLGGGHHHRNNEQQQKDLREARRLLKEKIRNDWTYSTLPQHTSSGRREQELGGALESVAGFRFHTPSNHERPRGLTGELLALDFDPVDWREREYSSASDSEDEVTPTAQVTKSQSELYRFDGPDSVGVQISDRRQARKRKRQLRLDEEVEWNDGLAHWLRRRDAWCSARTSAQVHALESNGHESASTDAEESASASSSPRTSTSSTIGPSSTPATSPSSTPDIQLASTNIVAASQAAPSEILIPIAPTILPDHPIRKRITAHLYPEIYTKIILQSRTPSVPINLLTLIKALVQGWKDDGEWPPKSGPVEKSIGRKKGSGESSLRQSVKAVGRVLRLTGTSEVGSRTSK